MSRTVRVDYLYNPAPAGYLSLGYWLLTETVRLLCADRIHYFEGLCTFPIFPFNLPSEKIIIQHFIISVRGIQIVEKDLKWNR